MAKFRVELDRVACQGFGACVELCPSFFQLSEVDEKSTLQGAKEIKEKDKVVTHMLELNDLSCTRAAADACPYNAIHIINTETGEKLI